MRETAVKQIAFFLHFLIVVCGLLKVALIIQLSYHNPCIRKLLMIQIGRKQSFLNLRFEFLILTSLTIAVEESSDNELLIFLPFYYILK